MINSIDNVAAIIDEELRERCRSSSKSLNTRHFIYTEAEAERAFLSLDIIKDSDYLVLYEIYVPISMRRKGMGSKVLIELSSFALERAYSSIVVSPAPLDHHLDQNPVGAVVPSKWIHPKKKWYR